MFYLVYSGSGEIVITTGANCKTTRVAVDRLEALDSSLFPLGSLCSVNVNQRLAAKMTGLEDYKNIARRYRMLKLNVSEIVEIKRITRNGCIVSELLSIDNN